MAGQQVHLFGDFVLDQARGCLLQAGQPVHLRRQAYLALACLASCPGCLVTKGQLTDEIWQGRAVTDDSLVQCIGDVRRALGDQRGERLRTVRGRGYILEVGAGGERPVPPSPAPARPRTADRGRFQAAQRAVVVGAGILAATAAALGLLSRDAAPLVGGDEAPTFVKLTSSSALELRPSLSSDGAWLLFDSITPPDFNGDSQLYLRPVDGTAAPACLTCGTVGGGRDGVFSPAGTAIAYATDSRDGGIVVMQRDGGSRRRLSQQGFHPAWSPDGRLIAFASRQTDWIPVGPLYSKSELWIADVVSGRTRRLEVDDARDPAWSPDGRFIAFWSQSPDGAGRDVFVVTSAGDHVRRVTMNAGCNWHPTWASDGRALFFLSNRSGSIGLWRVPMDRQTGAATGAATAVHIPSAFIAYPSVAANGDLVYTDAGASRNVHLLSLDVQNARLMGPLRPVTRGTDFWMMPRPSPGGGSIAMVRAAIGQQEDLYTIRHDGSGLRRLTNDSAIDREPDISSDERRIAFESNRGGRVGVWIADVDGTDPRPLTTPAGSAAWTAPRWSPDGRLIAARQEPGHAIVLLDPRRPDSPLQATLPLPSEAFDTSLSMPLALARLAWSTDSRQIAARFGPLLVIYSLAAGTFETKRIDGAIVGWPPGPFIVLDQWEEHRLLVLDTRTWHAREIPYAPHLQRDDRLMLSADGRTLAVERGAYQADVWLMHAGRH